MHFDTSIKPDFMRLTHNNEKAWQLVELFARRAHDLDDMIEAIAAWARPGVAVVIMSNGGFGGIHEKLIARLQGAAIPV